MENTSKQKKLRILETKLRKMVREELVKGGKNRFVSNIDQEWDTLETIESDIANYIILDSEFEHGASTEEIVRAIQSGIMHGKRGIKKK